MTSEDASRAPNIDDPDLAGVAYSDFPDGADAEGQPSEELSSVDALAQLSFLVHGMLERRAGERDVSIVVTRLMGILRDRRPTMNELATLLELDKSSVSGLVDRAVRRGLVLRTPSATDRRSVRVALTDTGKRMAADVTAEFGADVDVLLSRLSPDDRGALTRIATDVLRHHREAISSSLS
ncbi:MarR family winged helix-turn-helix transcriptional regulator [Rathayibacter sp. CAU 1779]